MASKAVTPLADNGTVCPCGEPIPPERARYKARYCSKLCQWRYKERAKQGTDRRYAEATCRVCGVHVPQEVHGGPPRRYCIEHKPAKAQVPYVLKQQEWKKCPMCGTVFKHPNHHRVYCSKVCSNRRNGQRKVAKRTGPNLRSESKVRRLKFQILAIHGPVCWLCDGPINLDFRWPHPRSFSVDHVIALADGGDPYDPTNAKPSHLHCNLSRGATEGNRKRGRRARERNAATG